jgi:hypothetical protein
MRSNRGMKVGKRARLGQLTFKPNQNSTAVLKIDVAFSSAQIDSSAITAFQYPRPLTKDLQDFNRPLFSPHREANDKKIETDCQLRLLL